MRGYLFIMHHYLGVKRKKLGFYNWKQLLENKQKASPDRHSCVRRMGIWDIKKCCLMRRGTWGNASSVNFAVFVLFFLSFFHLKMLWNLKWIFFILYCLQRPIKTIDLQSSYPRPFTWCLVLLIYMIFL